MSKPSSKSFRNAVDKTYAKWGYIVLAFKPDTPVKRGHQIEEVSGYWEWFYDPWVAQKKASFAEFLAWIDLLNSFLPKGKKVKREIVQGWDKESYKLYRCVRTGGL